MLLWSVYGSHPDCGAAVLQGIPAAAAAARHAVFLFLFTALPITLSLTADSIIHNNFAGVVVPILSQVRVI